MLQHSVPIGVQSVFFCRELCILAVSGYVQARTRLDAWIQSSALSVTITLLIASAAQRREFAVIFTSNQRWARVQASMDRRNSPAEGELKIG
jgi:hypothetical protein